jgi:hypothetical protein
MQQPVMKYGLDVLFVCSCVGMLMRWSRRPLKGDHRLPRHSDTGIDSFRRTTFTWSGKNSRNKQDKPLYGLNWTARVCDSNRDTRTRTGESAEAAASTA